MGGVCEVFGASSCGALSQGRITLISPLAQPVQEPLSAAELSCQSCWAGGWGGSAFSPSHWHGETWRPGSIFILDRINTKSVCQTVGANLDFFKSL